MLHSKGPKMRLITHVSAICLALALPVLASAPLAAQTPTQHVLLTACNDTTFPIWVAAGAVASQGWWKIEGGACTYVGSFLTYAVGFNVYAQAADGTNWRGSTSEDDWYCVDPNNAFTLAVGRRDNGDADCPSGYALKLFRFVDTPSGYGRDQDFSYTYHFHM